MGVPVGQSGLERADPSVALFERGRLVRDGGLALRQGLFPLGQGGIALSQRPVSLSDGAVSFRQLSFEPALLGGCVLPDPLDIVEQATDLGVLRSELVLEAAALVGPLGPLAFEFCSSTFESGLQVGDVIPQLGFGLGRLRPGFVELGPKLGQGPLLLRLGLSRPGLQPVDPIRGRRQLAPQLHRARFQLGDPRVPQAEGGAKVVPKLLQRAALGPLFGQLRPKRVDGSVPVPDLVLEIGNVRFGGGKLAFQILDPSGLGFGLVFGVAPGRGQLCLGVGELLFLQGHDLNELVLPNDLLFLKGVERRVVLLGAPVQLLPQLRLAGGQVFHLHAQALKLHVLFQELLGVFVILALLAAEQLLVLGELGLFLTQLLTQAVELRVGGGPPSPQAPPRPVASILGERKVVGVRNRHVFGHARKGRVLPGTDLRQQRLVFLAEGLHLALVGRRQGRRLLFAVATDEQALHHALQILPAIGRLRRQDQVAIGGHRLLPMAVHRRFAVGIGAVDHHRRAAKATVVLDAAHERKAGLGAAPFGSHQHHVGPLLFDVVERVFVRFGEGHRKTVGLQWRTDHQRIVVVAVDDESVALHGRIHAIPRPSLDQCGCFVHFPTGRAARPVLPGSIVSATR